MVMKIGEQDRGDIRKRPGDIMASFGLSLEDAEDRDQWRLRIEANQLTRVYLEMAIK